MSHAHDVAKRQARKAPPLTFTGFEDFTAAFNEARRQCAAVYGPRWDLHPQSYIWARLPAVWVRVRVAGKQVLLTSPGAQSTPSEDEIGSRWSRAPRDQKLPVARFWPNSELPVGPEYETGVITKPPKPRLAPSAELEKLRRPSGIGLPSGYERAEADFYVEPRWLVEALLRVESVEGRVHDPFCGGGNIVGGCLQKGLTATGSDLFDRGFGWQLDAFNITTPFENLISNPPFSRIEEVVRHFLPLVQRKLILLARINILEGQERRLLFDQSPPARIWVSSRRVSCPPGHLQHPRDEFGAMVPLPASGGSTAYCFVVWDRNYAGPGPIFGWL